MRKALLHWGRPPWHVNGISRNAVHYAQDVVGMSGTECTATTDIVPSFQATDPATIRWFQSAWHSPDLEGNVVNWQLCWSTTHTVVQQDALLKVWQALNDAITVLGAAFPTSGSLLVHDEAKYTYCSIISSNRSSNNQMISIGCRWLEYYSNPVPIPHFLWPTTASVMRIVVSNSRARLAVTSVHFCIFSTSATEWKYLWTRLSVDLCEHTVNLCPDTRKLPIYFNRQL